ncbi:MAG: FAD-dependent oxidoreductase, partial [Mobilitalea sp.]
NGTSLSITGLFVAIGVAGSVDLAKKLGAETENNKILTDENMATNIPGLYAAGDCTGGLLQISKAVYEGAKAGTEIIKYLRNHNNRKSA